MRRNSEPRPPMWAAALSGGRQARRDPIAAEEFRSRFRDSINVRGSLAAEFRGVNRLLDFEFLQGIDRRRNDKIVEVLVRDRNAIQRVKIVSRTLTRDDHLPARLRKRRSARAHRR